MLAVKVADLASLPYPMLSSFKLDGIRCLITSDGPKARSMKSIPNNFIRDTLAQLPCGLDGEIAIVLNGEVNFRETSSAVMSFDGMPNFRFFVFDDFSFPDMPFIQRYQSIPDGMASFVEKAMQWTLNCAADVVSMYDYAIAQRYEGLILRRLDAPYKFGRSTLKQGYMLKVKPCETDEALVIGMEPEYENTNAQTFDERGYAVRSSHQDGLIARERMGALIVENKAKWSASFKIGTGFTHAEREQIWQQRTSLIGSALASFNYLPVGGYDVPRNASFKGFRSRIDMS